MYINHDAVRQKAGTLMMQRHQDWAKITLTPNEQIIARISNGSPCLTLHGTGSYGLVELKQDHSVNTVHSSSLSDRLIQLPLLM